VVGARAGRQPGSEPTPLYAAVRFAGLERQSVTHVEIIFENAAAASRFAMRAGWDDFAVGPVHFHLAAQPAQVRWVL
jgi:hypothetical protein